MDPVALAAHGESLWHRLGLAALGIGWVSDGEVAWRTRQLAGVPRRAVAAGRGAGRPARPGRRAVGRRPGRSRRRQRRRPGPFGFVLQGASRGCPSRPGGAEARPRPPSGGSVPLPRPRWSCSGGPGAHEELTGSTATPHPGRHPASAASLRVPASPCSWLVSTATRWAPPSPPPTPPSSTSPASPCSRRPAARASAPTSPSPAWPPPPPPGRPLEQRRRPPPLPHPRLPRRRPHHPVVAPADRAT